MKIIRNIRIVTTDNVFPGEILIGDDGRISGVLKPGEYSGDAEIIEGNNCLAMAGVIDTHVHFRDPGMTRKGDMESESRAALLGGVTTIFDMPNTTPATTTVKALEDKIRHASEVSPIHCGFFIGATANNMEDVSQYREACGIKLFLGSSTGNMGVSDFSSIENAFRQKEFVVVVHCEDDAMIKKAMEQYSGEIPFREHPNIRSRKACIKSTEFALQLAVKYGTRLHIAHVSTAEEVKMIEDAKKLNPNITAETSPNYLWFDNDPYGPDGENIYDTYGALAKCNPAIKTGKDRRALLKAICNGAIDSVATDHAPHLFEEKQNDYVHAPSGIPSIQHSLQMMLTLADNNPELDLCRITRLMSARPAEIFGIEDRGTISEGKLADIVLVNPDKFVRVVKELPEICEDDIAYSRIAYKCGWSLMEGELLRGEIIMTLVEGKVIR